MKKDLQKKLIFIYNANSGLRNILIDGVHKILSPSTYNCKLCAITHGAFKEYTTWRKFRLESKILLEFLYKNEFEKEYASKLKQNYTYPVILVEHLNRYDILISSEELNNIKDVTKLIDLIQKRVKT